MKSVKELNVEDFDIEVDEEAFEKWQQVYKTYTFMKIAFALLVAFLILLSFATGEVFSVGLLPVIIFFYYSMKEHNALKATGLKRKDVEEARNS